MIGEALTDENGNVISMPSLYMPPKNVREFILKVKQDYETGDRILHHSYEEFNDRSVFQVYSDDQRTFNSYIPERSDDPDESWKSNAIRPITRNKIVSIAAHITAKILYPGVTAQNKEDAEDKQAANVMRDLIKWNIDNSDYEMSFLFGVITALYSPALYLKAEFNEVLMDIRERNKNGEIDIRQAVDEVLSGFNTLIVPVDEMMINNAYEYNIQRQKCLIRRRYIDFDEGEALYGHISNFKDFVQPRIQVFYSEEHDTFYQQKDEELQTLVEEVTYYNRREDVEVIFVNGIPMTDIDNKMSHRRVSVDINGQPITIPIYPFAKTGYEPIDEKRFFFYKSAVSKLGPDQELVNTLYQMIMDGTFLSIFPPQNVFGDEAVGSSVVIPGATNYFGKSTTITPYKLGSDLQAGYQALTTAERSITESSQDDLRGGTGSQVERTAFETARIEQNAKTQLGLFGKMIGRIVKDFGQLMVDDIIMHQTVGEVEEITAGQVRLGYRSFLLSDDIENGKKVSKRIIFTDESIGLKVTKKEALNRSFKIMDKEGGRDSNTRIFKVNPMKFRMNKYMLSINPDDLMPKNELLEKAMNLEAYDRGITNPVSDIEAVTKDFLWETYAKGESDKYMKKASTVEGEIAKPGKKQSSPLVDQVSKISSLPGLFKG